MWACAAHSSNLKKSSDSFCGLATFVHSGYDQVGPANHVATSEDLRIARLVGNDAHGFDENATTVECVDGVILEPRRWIRAKTEGDDHSIGRQDGFGSGNRFGAPATV